MLAVRDDDVQDERRREGEHVVVHPAPERALVLYHRRDAHGGKERVPDDIEHRKLWHEGDIVVYERVRDPIALRGRVFLDDEKGDYVDDEIQREETVPVRPNEVPDLAEQLAYYG